MSTYGEIQATSIELFSELFVEFVKEGNLEGIVSLYEPNAVFVDRDGKLTSGSSAIRELYRGLFSIKPEFQIQSSTATIYAGDIALNIGDWQLTGTASDGSKVSDSGRAYDVYRRQPDGTWKVVIDNPYGYGVITSAR